MTQPTQSAPEPNQDTVKDHVKTMLRRIPRKPQPNGQSHQRTGCDYAGSDSVLKRL
jgi:hypothetical protein